MAALPKKVSIIGGNALEPYGLEEQLEVFARLSTKVPSSLYPPSEAFDSSGLTEPHKGASIPPIKGFETLYFQHYTDWSTASFYMSLLAYRGMSDAALTPESVERLCNSKLDPSALLRKAGVYRVGIEFVPCDGISVDQVRATTARSNRVETGRSIAGAELLAAIIFNGERFMKRLTTMVASRIVMAGMNIDSQDGYNLVPVFGWDDGKKMFEISAVWSHVPLYGAAIAMVGHGACIRGFKPPRPQGVSLLLR